MEISLSLRLQILAWTSSFGRVGKTPSWRRELSAEVRWARRGQGEAAHDEISVPRGGLREEDEDHAMDHGK